MSPVTPRLIKHTLQKCSANSSPGPDKIIYLHLSSTHYFLATLFSKILENLPPSLFQAEIIWISKGGDPSQPANFSPIILSVFHPRQRSPT